MATNHSTKPITISLDISPDELSSIISYIDSNIRSAAQFESNADYDEFVPLAREMYLLSKLRLSLSQVLSSTHA